MTSAVWARSAVGQPGPDGAPPAHREPSPAASASPGGHRWSAATATAAVVVGMLAAAVVRDGAYYPDVAVGVAALATLVVIAVVWRGTDRRGWLVTTALGALALWWLVRSISAGTPKAFLPFGASVVGFAAAFGAVRGLDRPGRRIATVATVAVLSLTAGLGLVALAGRWSPLATRSAGSWRLATTVGYANAAALLVGLGLLLALGLDEHGWPTRAAVALCLAALVATQSVSGLVAVGVGAAFVPWSCWRRAHRPLAAGLGAGTLLVTASAASGPARGLALVAVVGVLAWGIVVGARRAWVSVVLVLVAAVALAGAVTTSSHHLFAAGADRTSVGWRTATHDWTAVAVRGRGPQGVSNLRSPVRVSANLIGDDYLQVGVDSGLVGLVLLGACVASVAAVVRRRDRAASAATGALVAFGLVGALDFSWHLPAVAVVGGIVAGLAAAPVVGPVLTPLGVLTGRSSARRRARVAAAVLAVTALVGGLVWLGSGTDSAVASAHGDPVPTTAVPRPVTGPGPGAGATPAPAPLPTIADGPGRVIAAGPDLTDPFILHEGRSYYLYTSEGATAMNVPVRVGTAVDAWGPATEALPTLPAWAVGGATWAPDVHRVVGGYALYFSALVRDRSPATHCVGAAFGSSPVGPFVADDHPFVCQLDHRGTIDPRTFVDTDGSLVLDYKSEDNANPSVAGPDQNGRTTIWAQRLSPDGRRLVGPSVALLSPTQTWEGTILEAPQMVDVAGNDWLFFSGGWYDSPGYGIGFALCKGAFGPCTDLSPAPLLGSNAQGAGPGESSVFVESGQAWLLYDPWHADDPAPTPPRPVLMAPLGFGSAGPYLAHP